MLQWLRDLLRLAPTPNLHGNSIHKIHPYRSGRVWVFDDERVGLVREPFVAGTNSFINAALRRLHIDGRRGFEATFSASPFPGHQYVLTRVQGDSHGTVYRTQFGSEAWLCPALFRYFKTAPEQIFLQVEGDKERPMTNRTGFIVEALAIIHSTLTTIDELEELEDLREELTRMLPDYEGEPGEAFFEEAVVMVEDVINERVKWLHFFDRGLVRKDDSKDDSKDDLEVIHFDEDDEDEDEPIDLPELPKVSTRSIRTRHHTPDFLW